MELFLRLATELFISLPDQRATVEHPEASCLIVLDPLDIVFGIPRLTLSLRDRDSTLGALSRMHLRFTDLVR
jgi:hypothetical protein